MTLALAESKNTLGMIRVILSTLKLNVETMALLRADVDAFEFALRNTSAEVQAAYTVAKSRNRQQVLKSVAGHTEQIKVMQDLIDQTIAALEGKAQ